MGRFTSDFDHGVAKYQVLQEAQEGWERLKVEGSPTFVLRSGKQYTNVGLPQIILDEKRHFRPVAVQPAPCKGEECLDLYRHLFAEALGQTGSTPFTGG